MDKQIISLQKQINLKESKVDSLESEQDKLKSDRADDRNQLFQKYFSDVLEDGKYVLNVYGESFRVYTEDDSINLVGITFDRDGWSGPYDRISTNFYTTRSSSMFEFTRMVLIGKVGAVLRDFHDDVLAEFNSIHEKYAPELDKLGEEMWKVKKEVEKLKLEISEIEKNIALDAFEKDGIEFSIPDNEEYWRLPKMDIKWDTDINQVTKVRMLSKTASGKSCDLEVETIGKDWSYGDHGFKVAVRTRVFNRVRMSNVESFIKKYKHILVS